MLSMKYRKLIGTGAFALPPMVALLMDAIGSSEVSSGASAAALVEMFVASAVFATAVIAFTIMTAPKPVGTRLGFLAIALALLFLEVWCALLWILRGLD
jgi:hypothetical protein